MKKLRLGEIFSLVMAVLLLASNASGVESKESWEENWERVKVGARKEGRLSIYATWAPEIRISLTNAFKKRHGIDLEFTPFARGEQLLPKLQQENRAGLYIADVFGTGGPTTTTTLKPAGLLGNIETMLMLPEVVNPKAWSGGEFPFYDEDKQVIAMINSIKRSIFFNTNMVKKGEITSYKDLLKPQYKDKLVINDPTVTGTGNASFTHLAYRVWNVDEASKFLRQLIKEQNAAIDRNNRQPIEWVSRGKYAIGYGGDPIIISQFLSAGAPLYVAFTKEGTYSSSSGGCIAVPKVSAHPNGTIVFVNWLLSQEGQTIFAEAWNEPSLRKDVTVKKMHPEFLPRPGEKIAVASEQFAKLQQEARMIAKKIIEEAQK